MMRIVPRSSHERIARRNLKRLDLSRIESLVDIAVQEDFGKGDPTSEITVGADEAARGLLVSREEIVVSGMEMVPLILKKYDPRLEFKPLVPDGHRASVAATMWAAASSEIRAHSLQLDPVVGSSITVGSG